MRNQVKAMFLVAMAAGLTLAGAAWANDPPKSDTPAAAPAAAAAASAGGETKTLAEAVKAEKGTLKNPYTDKPEAIAEGKKLYLSFSCNGCHGGGGGGGMCPPLTNDTWVYGSDDDTLFRLIAIGSKELQAQGAKRKGQEGVVGPMPPYVDIIKSDQDLWKVIAFIRSVFGGDISKRNW